LKSGQIDWLSGAMSYREVELLRSRALRMLSSAKGSFANEDYDIAAFLADQAVQLYLKSEILNLTGEIPRIHAVRQLFQMLKIALGEADEVDRFVRDNRSLLIRLEDAYISSRYIPKEYEREEVKEPVTFAEDVIKFVQRLKGQA